MFYQVRVYNSQNELKETITPHELSGAYWRKNLTLEKKIKLVKRVRDFSYLEPLELDADLFTSKGEPRVQLSFQGDGQNLSGLEYVFEIKNLSNLFVNLFTDSDPQPLG